MMPEELPHCSSLRQDFPKHLGLQCQWTISRESLTRSAGVKRFSSSFLNLRIFFSQSGTRLRVRGRIPSPDGSFTVVDLCFVFTLRTQPRHFITLVLPTKHLFDPDGP